MAATQLYGGGAPCAAGGEGGGGAAVGGVVARGALTRALQAQIWARRA